MTPKPRQSSSRAFASLLLLTFLLISEPCLAGIEAFGDIAEIHEAEWFELTPKGLMTGRGGTPGRIGSEFPIALKSGRLREFADRKTAGFQYPLQFRTSVNIGSAIPSFFAPGDPSVLSRPHQTVQTGDALYYYQSIDLSSFQLVRHRRVNSNAADAITPVGPVFTGNPGAVAEYKGPEGGILWSAGTPATLYWRKKNQATVSSYILPASVGTVEKIQSVNKLLPDGSRVWQILLLGEDNRFLKTGPLFTGTPGSLTLLSNDITDFAVREEHILEGADIYLTRVLALKLFRESRQGQLIRYNITDNDFYVDPISPVGRVLTYIAADQNRIYVTDTPWAEQQAGGLVTYPNQASSTIYSKIDPADDWDRIEPGPYTPIAVNYAGQELQSDGSFLFWRSNSAVLRIETGAPPVALDFALIGAEITQSVQDLNNSVPLVAERQAALRAFAYWPLNTTDRRNYYVTAKATATLNGARLAGEVWADNSPELSSTIDLLRIRPDLQKSFNFTLPDNWTRLPGTLAVTVTINPNGSLPETTLANNSMTKTLTIQPARYPTLAFVPVLATRPIYKPWFAPPAFVWNVTPVMKPEFRDILLRTKSLMPVSDFKLRFVNSELTDDSDPFDFSKDGDDDDEDALCELEDFAEDCWDVAPDTHWIAMLDQDEPWNWGGLAPRPGTVSLSKMYSGDDDKFSSFYGGIVVAHELAHNYGRKHIDCGGPLRPDDNPAIRFPCALGTDVGTALTDFRVPTGWDFNGPRDPYLKDRIDYFVNTYQSTRVAISSQTPGYTMTGDLMTYSAVTWTSPFTWNALLNAIPVTPGPGARAARDNGAGQLHAGVVQVSAVVDKLRRRAMSFRVRSIPPNSASPAKVSASLAELAGGVGSPVTLRLLNGNNVIADYGLPEPELSEGDGNTFPIVQYVPAAAGITTVQLWLSGTLIGETRVSPNAPAVQLGSPVVDPIRPLVSLNWAAQDMDGDEMHFITQASCDGGNTWQTVANSRTAMGVVLDASLLPGSADCCLRVLATDGFHTTIVTTPAFSIPTHAPGVSITGIAEGDSVAFGTTLQTVASAYDAEDGTLFGITWSLTATGGATRTATGDEVRWADLVPGTYTLMAAAVDSEGKSGSSAVTFTVLAPAISEGTIPPVVDGYCADEAYQSATAVRLIPGLPEPITHLVHVDGNLYICLSGSTGGSSFVIYLDPDGSGGTQAQAGDLKIAINRDTTIQVFHGNGAGTWDLAAEAEIDGVRSSISEIQDGAAWNAEVCIPDTLLGGWNKSIGFAFHVLKFGGLPAQVAWPTLGVAFTGGSPASQAPAFLGTPPPAPNAAPDAAAEGPMVVDSATKGVALNAGGSTDADGDPLTYQWTQTAGPGVAFLTSSGTATPTFDAPSVTVPTVLAFSLAVRDATHTSTAAFSMTVVPAPASQPVPSPGLVSLDAGTGKVTVILQWNGDSGDRVKVQTSPDLIQWEDIDDTIVGNSLRVSVTHQPAAPGPRRYYRLRSVTQASLNAGTAAHFDGTTGLISVPHSAALNTLPITITAWVRTTVNDNIPRGIVSKYFDSSRNGYTLLIANGRLDPSYWSASGTYVWNTAGTAANFIADGIWHHVAWTVDSGGAKVYIDGTLRDTITWVGLPGVCTTNEPLQFGKYSSSDSFNGDLDEVTIWNTALTAAQVEAVRLVTPNAGTAGLVSLWTFDESVPNPTITLSPMGPAFTGSVTGNVTWPLSGAPVFRP